MGLFSPHTGITRRGELSIDVATEQEIPLLSARLDRQLSSEIRSGVISPSYLKRNSNMIDVKRVLELHRETVARWHSEEIDNRYDGVMGLICTQHQFNFRLWHEEDIARSPDVGDERIAAVKRAIDGFNQKRNDWIEKVDDWITGELIERRIAPAEDARLNTETPGSTIDRLSILSLRIYHLNEQLERTDASAEHIRGVQRKLAIAGEQQADLSQSLHELIEGILAGSKRHKTYRQMKMYNDPSMNPYLYQRKAG